MQRRCPPTHRRKVDAPRGRPKYARHVPDVPGRESSVLGAGILRFELVDPYRLWELHLVGDVGASSVAAQMDGVLPGAGEPTPVEAHIQLHPCVPPWMNGALLHDAKLVLETQEEGDLMGHPWRFEQLCRSSGLLRIGDQQFEIDGGANRIRRAIASPLR